MPSAIIAGTMIYDIPGATFKEELVETPYGEAMIQRVQGDFEDLIFLARHGITHDTPPTKSTTAQTLKP